MAFSEKAKLAVAVYQDVETKGLHADHIYPKSKGGSDDVTNLQFLTPKVNMQKSNHVYQPREWQQEFADKWRKHEPSKPFLLVAVPGAGKTDPSLAVAREFLSEHEKPCLIAVVPTINLQKQWRDKATTFGIDLQTKEFGTNFKSGFMGGVATYQSLDSQAQLFRKICSSRPTMVIFDEPHHCGDKESWGMNARIAFELANRKLLLSGTPFRTDCQPIPFVSYDDEDCIADMKYGYPHCLQDRVVRHLRFDYGWGKYTILEDGPNGTVQQDYELNKSLAPEDAEGRLWRILNPAGNFVSEQIRIAHTKLQEARLDIPDAAAMAVCIDQQHARDVAKLIHKITGSRPAIIVSDEDTATETTDEFRHSKKEWLVSVRQVSEGTDIPRLQVLCYLTNATTELFFRQLVGRVSRVRFREKKASNENMELTDLTAHVVLPADPRLIAHAKLIEQFQKHAIIEETEQAIERDASDQRDRPISIFLGSEHFGTDTIVIGSKQYSPTEAALIEQIRCIGCITPEKAALIFEKCMKGSSLIANIAAPSVSSPVSLEDTNDSIRREIKRKTAQLANMLKCEYRAIHIKFSPRQEDMSREQLEAKLRTIQLWIKNGCIG